MNEDFDPSILIELLQRPIAYHKCFVDITNSVTAAVMLSQAFYWTKHTSDPDRWFYKSQCEWEKETGLSRSEQETARKKLRGVGVIEEKKQGVPCKLFFRINVKTLYARLQDSSKPVCGNPANKKAGKAQASVLDSCNQNRANPANNLYTEITTETKTKTTTEITYTACAEPIYNPPTKISSESDLPMQQTLIVDMAEEKETPIPPTPLASFPPENVGLAIAKPQKSKKQKELKVDPNLFLQIWLQDSPRNWVQHRTIDSRTIRQLINFTNEFENSLEIFQKGLWFAQTDKSWCLKPEKNLGMSNVLSDNLIFKFYQRYEDQQRRSQQLQSPNNSDRPMTPSDINKAEKFLRYKEALTA